MLGKIAQFFIYLFVKSEMAKPVKCKKCKAVMDAWPPKMYLLPCSFDDRHPETAEYYLNNTESIDDETQIPTGRRACNMTVFVCPDCGYKKVDILDFLKVREDVLLKGGEEFEYSLFTEYIEKRI